MKTISIVIPVYNEKTTLHEIIKRVEDSDTLGLKKEIVLVDDLSTDGSKSIIEELAKKPHIKGVYHHENRGKGAALRSGFREASGDFILVQDADLEYNPVDYPKLLQPLVDGRADAVFGSRFMGNDAHRVHFFWHMIANKILTTLSNMMTNLNLTDMEVCYKVFTKEVMHKILPRLKSNRFGFEPEVTARLSRVKAKVYEVGISYSGRTYEEGKKIGWKDAVAAFWHIFYYNVIDR